jgi:hypothetical protein
MLARRTSRDNDSLPSERSMTFSRIRFQQAILPRGIRVSHARIHRSATLSIMSSISAGHSAEAIDH